MLIAGRLRYLDEKVVGKFLNASGEVAQILNGLRKSLS